jgi:hypothetical protein
MNLVYYKNRTEPSKIIPIEEALKGIPLPNQINPNSVTYISRSTIWNPPSRVFQPEALVLITEYNDLWWCIVPEYKWKKRKV